MGRSRGLPCSRDGQAHAFWVRLTPTRAGGEEVSVSTPFDFAGRWKATTAQNRTIIVSYRLVSNGSALVETFTSSSSGKETLSVYHRDGGALMLTHYCAQGNQARLKAVEATRERVVFSFLDATNAGGEQDVMQRLSFVLRPDGFDQESVYRLPNGEQESTTLRFSRAD